MSKTLIYGVIALIIVIIAAAVTFLLNPPTSDENVKGDDSGFFSSLFPFNFGANNGSVETPLFEGEGGGQGEQAAPRLRQVSVSPVSGAYLFDKDGKTFIRFIDRATGHVYETAAESTGVKRITNTTVPGIQEVLWANENQFLVRYLSGDSIETFYVSLDKNTEAEQSLNGSFVESFLRGTLDPEGGSLFAVFNTTQGANLVVSDVSGGNARTVLSSAIKSWVPLQSDNGLFIYTAPLSSSPGFLYQVSNGTFTKILGDVPGLMARVHPYGSHILISSGGTDSVDLSLFETETGRSFSSPLGTFADKCAFDRNDSVSAYCAVPHGTVQDALDNWLLGTASFSDALWHIDFEFGTAEFILEPEDAAGVEMDMYHLSISPDGQYLLFMNKNDLSLWSLRLQETASSTNTN